MILAMDVHYAGDGGTVAGVAFERWTDARAARGFTTVIPQVAPYVPGEFYRRELPCLLALLREHALAPECLVIDGHVTLDAQGRPGLGKHLYDALGAATAVVGIAKTPFAGLGDEHAVLRGDSRRPLYVTCAGLTLAEAKGHVAAMHGAHRLPTLPGLVDRLCRSGG